MAHIHYLYNVLIHSFIHSYIHFNSGNEAHENIKQTHRQQDGQGIYNKRVKSNNKVKSSVKLTAVV